MPGLEIHRLVPYVSGEDIRNFSGKMFEFKYYVTKRKYQI
jgi:hypothetical protein